MTQENVYDASFLPVCLIPPVISLSITASEANTEFAISSYVIIPERDFKL